MMQQSNQHSHPSAQHLIAQFWQQSETSGQSWLHQALESIATSDSQQQAMDNLLLASARARRKLGQDCLLAQEQAPNWYMDQVARLILLRQLQQQVSPQQWPKTAFAVYRQFDENEKAVILRSLDWLCGDSSLTNIALDAGRTNDVQLFATLALHNPYPAKHYAERAFEQLVLKSLFLDLDISHISGLCHRVSPQLSELCIDLVQEKRLANRQVPGSIWLGMVFQHLSPQQRDIYQDFVFNQGAQHQHFTLLAMLRNGTQDIPSTLVQRLQTLASEHKASNTNSMITQLLTRLEPTVVQSCGQQKEISQDEVF